jgi:predicted nuclease of predicted toxin-antitoxin system
MLLLDEHLSRHLVPRLKGIFPGIKHVVLEGLESHDDRAIWEYAKSRGLVIVTKDSDFLNAVLMLGPPPKVILLQIGNAPTSRIEEVLVRWAAQVVEFCVDLNRPVLLLH